MNSVRPSPAMLVALLALFVALGGSGYAAVKISGKQIKNRSIAAEKLKLGTLTGKEVKDGSIRVTDLQRGLPAGGSPGQLGQPGSPGIQGPPGISELRVATAESAYNSDVRNAARAVCPIGMKAIGGGGQITAAALPNPITILRSSPASGDDFLLTSGAVPDGWYFEAFESAAFTLNWGVTAYALCARFS